MYTVTLSVRFLLFPLALVALVLLAATTSRAAVYTVTQTTDSNFPNPDPTILSLRGAVDKANQHPGLDLIIIPEGTYSLTIPGSGDDTNLSGDLDILDPVIIQGAGPDKTIIDGGAIDRVLHIPLSSSDISVLLVNLTIQNGKVTSTTGILGGGGILNRKKLSLSNVVVRNNVAEGVQGAGINNEQELTLSKVMVRDNTVVVTGEQSQCVGGGIRNGGSLAVAESTFSGNRADRGGGLFNAGLATATIERSLFTQNRAKIGSGIGAYGILNLTNTTIHANEYDGIEGGRCALQLYETGMVSFCTITDNHSSSEEGVGLCTSSPSSLTLRSTILSGNKKPGTITSGNCTFYTPPTSATYNLEDANTCNFSPATNLINTDPKLGPLQNNGGPTQTRALLDGSPAIDYVRIDTGVTVDQRGFTRPIGPWADIGAYENEPPPLCFPVKSPDGKTAVICL